MYTMYIVLWRMSALFGASTILTTHQTQLAHCVHRVVNMGFESLLSLEFLTRQSGKSCKAENLALAMCAELKTRNMSSRTLS